MAAAKMLQAVTSFAGTDAKGVEHLIRQGDVVPANHPAVKGREELFKNHDPASPTNRETGSA
jgi:hypothetical protein